MKTTRGIRFGSQSVSVLFSEPKIPQCERVDMRQKPAPVFQCSSASRKFLNLSAASSLLSLNTVSVLFSEPKIPQSVIDIKTVSAKEWASVSVLFSEPKIPQYSASNAGSSERSGFSALQRAENSSMHSAYDQPCRAYSTVSVLFSEPKIPQFKRGEFIAEFEHSFSALQRAENSSMLLCRTTNSPRSPFQCSSASRKFLNGLSRPRASESLGSFSALQRAENSSMQTNSANGWRRACFSALQRAENSSIIFRPPRAGLYWSFSALQRAENSSIAVSDRPHRPDACFSALQRAENSSITSSICFSFRRARTFQCSSASRKFLNLAEDTPLDRHAARFSALQRAENSSIPTLAPASIHIPDCDDHASSFLSLPGASP